MFNEVWKMKEGFVFGAGLILVGLALQFSVGPIHWSDFAFPINLIFLIVFLLILVLAYWLRSSLLATSPGTPLFLPPHCGGSCTDPHLCSCTHGSDGTHPAGIGS